MDGASRDVPRQFSPFSDRAFSFEELDKVKNDLRKHRLLTDQKSALSTMLESAILFGALLDWNAADAWLNSVAAGRFDADEGWVDFDLRLPSGALVPRRWFADPLTAGMLKETRAMFLDRVGTNRPDSAEAAVRLALDINSPGPRIATAVTYDDELPHRLMHTARVWWRLRLPGVLAEYAAGNIPSQSLSNATWHRITTGKRGSINPPPKQKPVRSAARPNQDKPEKGGYTKLTNDCTKIRRILSGVRALNLATRYKATKSRLDLEGANLETRMGGYIRDWVVECLEHGYDASGRARRQRPRGLAPSTLLSATSALRNDAAYGLMRAIRDAPKIAAAYELAIDRASSPGQAAIRARAFQRFHRWLVINAGYPELNFEIEADHKDSRVNAALVTEAEYFRAMAIAAPDEMNTASSRGELLRVALILGFRAGLRPFEALNVRVDDFRRGTRCFELVVRPSRTRALKSPNAKRVLPLHLLLTDAEEAEIVQCLRTRVDRLNHQTSGAMLFPLPNNGHEIGYERDDLEDQLSKILKRATGNQLAVAYDLRHSFASYLMATILMPPEAEQFAYRSIGPDCISHARRQRLATELLGHSLGRPALYAIAFLMGHAAPNRTLATYSHLLDWSLRSYVNRAPPWVARNAGRSTEGTNSTQGAFRVARMDTVNSIVDRATLPSMAPGWRTWSIALSQVADGGTVALAAAQHGVDQNRLSHLHLRLKAVLAIRTTHGKSRHRLVATAAADRTPFAPPRMDEGSLLIDEVWARVCLEGPGLESVPGAIWAIETYLRHLDPARCDVPFKTPRDALRYANALQAIGFDRSSIKARYQYSGTSARSPWLALPDFDGEEISASSSPAISRIRIAVVSGSGEQASATYSYRYAMVLAALVSDAQIPGIGAATLSK